MKTRSQQALRVLFPHQDDPAYQKVEELEELIAPLVGSRATQPFKDRLQRAIVRLADALVDNIDEDDECRRERVLFRGLRDCRKAASAVRLMFRAGVITRALRTTAFELLANVAQTLIERIHELLGLPTPGPLAPSVDVTPEGAPSKAELSLLDGGGGSNDPTPEDQEM
jgi:hypothetical protein